MFLISHQRDYFIRTTNFLIYNLKKVNERNRKKIIRKYKIAYEYYLFELYTFEKDSKFESCFKKNVDKIKKKIEKYDFEFDYINETILIDYKAFNLNF